MHREREIRSGRSRNKNSNKKRVHDLSCDPKYKTQNYNKLTKSRPTTSFSFVKKCNYTNRVCNQMEALLRMKEELNEL